MHAQVILFAGIGHVIVDTITLLDLGADHVLVETAYSCISPGTELRCLAGEQPRAAAWPFIPGYALTGTVIARGSNVEIAPGTAVFCRGTQAASRSRMWGGHVSHAVVAASEVYPLPRNAALQASALAAMAAIALHVCG